MQPNYGLLQAVAPALHKLVQIARSVFHKHLRWLVWWCCSKNTQFKLFLHSDSKRSNYEWMEPTELHCEMALLIFNKNLSGFLTEFRFWYFIVKLSVPPTSGVILNKRGWSEFIIETYWPSMIFTYNLLDNKFQLHPRAASMEAKQTQLAKILNK